MCGTDGDCMELCLEHTCSRSKGYCDFRVAVVDTRSTSFIGLGSICEPGIWIAYGKEVRVTESISIGNNCSIILNKVEVGGYSVTLISDLFQ